ncbi:MAG TPA: DUF1513 domain-containing protein [Thermohalobaculum sp.]|nr:DUF1513 domain-containing protein [Thermohalobaculum sp.]
MWRRQFLTGLGAGIAGAGFAAANVATARADQARDAILYVPGYDSGTALSAGRLIAGDRHSGRAVPRGYKGPVTLLSRVDLESGETIRAAFPVQGHSIALTPSRDLGVFSSIRDHRMITFNARSLDLVAVSEPFAPGTDGGDPFTGGGHCKFLPESGLLLVTERAPYRTVSNRLENHYGRLTLRDPETLKVVESHSCHGLHPHDLQLLEGGRLVAVANYGRTRNRDRSSVVPEIVEPSVTVIEVASGKLLEKIVVPPQGAETRHLTAAGDDNLFVVQVAMGPPGTEATWKQKTPVARDRLSQRGEVYLPSPLLRVARRDGRPMPLAQGEAAAFMRHGLSIVHDPAHDQIIATFPGSHSVMVADAASGAITHVLRTDSIGLRYPCGVALHPDGRRYIVTGSFENIYVFDRATHRLDHDACRYLPLFHHSHILVA